jgi:hypothetical protein
MFYFGSYLSLYYVGQREKKVSLEWVLLRISGSYQIIAVTKARVQSGNPEEGERLPL